MSARILVVDDVDVNVRLLEAKLTIEYYDVLTCNSGAAALTLAAEQQPDLILLDVDLPDMDGREAVKLLRKGGIGEKRFEVAADVAQTRFLLFPTVAHSHAERVRPEHRDLLKAAAEASGQKITIRMQPGYDHSYFFMASFIADHIAFHAERLKT